MVLIHVKHGDDSQFLYEASLETPVDECTLNITSIYNGRLKISRICNEMEELKKHGTLLPPEIMGLTDEQVVELKLIDTWGEKCIPSGGYTFHKDPVGRRNGKRPNEQMQNVLTKTIEEAKACVSKKLVQSQIPLTQKKVQEALDILRGAIMIVYPMNLPPHDNIRLEIENNEDLSGTHASLEVIAPNIAQLWFSGRELVREPNKKMKDYLGRNEKTKVVLKLTKTGSGPPAREPPLSEQDRKLLMAEAFKKQEELKKLDQDDDDVYLNSPWADGRSLKRNLHHIDNISWKPTK
ncbi:cilia- and flagella-associated protein 298-like isoform X2 [Rhopalosiphum maidis]|uniref:cilia- and flagella-associated protein 298-like isoform X2 n=1 Tax=Rhopalosiphum maidis TaxID=43146 RepID=UPI000EFED5D0|nr:cilia- and flagella-associated protein 298-like isoform X2 [Rhopalosiphum maidis]XP_026810251.1 cilia- and flagella-associated protein 298-like isoform X2 [Rhopalosiphum maidis]